MKSLPPIPTPLALRWREFRIKFFPGVIVLAALLACVVIWVRHVAPPTLVGQVEAVRANVSSTMPGTLTQLRVTLLKEVHAKDPVAVVITTDPKVLESSLAVIKAEVALIRVGMDPLANKERNELDFERLRLDSLDQRVLLATARVQLHYAEAEFERIANLFYTQTNIVTQAQYDLALRDRDAARTEVESRTKLVNDSEQGLERLRLADSAKAPTRADDTIPARLLEEPFAGGPSAGRRIGGRVFDESLDEYYGLRGWDAGGVPIVAKLRELEMAGDVRRWLPR